MIIIADVVYDLKLEHDILLDIHIFSRDEISNSLRVAQPIFINAIKQGIYA